MMAAFEARHAARLGQRFAAWWNGHAALLGPMAPATLDAAPGLFAQELRFVELQREEQQFLYMAARLRMPEMGDEQFIAVMNVIVAQDDTETRIGQIQRISREGTGVGTHG